MPSKYLATNKLFMFLITNHSTQLEQCAVEFSPAVIGAYVISRTDFSGVPAGTMGMIDELYDGGFMVAWDLPDRPLPEDWTYEGQWAVMPGIPLRDGFSYSELKHLRIPSEGEWAKLLGP